MRHFTGIVESMREFDQTGEAFVCVTLAGAKGSIPQEIGAKMLVTEAGRSCGTIGGGRVEEPANSLHQKANHPASWSNGICKRTSG